MALQRPVASGARIAPAAETVRTPRVRSTALSRAATRRVRWFLLGLGFGVIVAMVARGESAATLHDLREWSARTLRSLEHHPRSTTTNAGPVDAPTAQASVVVRPKEAPCPVDPGPADPCAQLLAPFRASGAGPVSPAVASLEVPTVPVESLPHVKPVVIARRHPRPARVAPAPQPVPAEDDSDDADADSADEKTPPPASPPKRDDVTPPEPAPAPPQQQTAANDT
jgi:hypothetical protein